MTKTELGRFLKDAKTWGLYKIRYNEGDTSSEIFMVLTKSCNDHEILDHHFFRFVGNDKQRARDKTHELRVEDKHNKKNDQKVAWDDWSNIWEGTYSIVHVGTRRSKDSTLFDKPKIVYSEGRPAPKGKEEVGDLISVPNCLMLYKDQLQGGSMITIKMLDGEDKEFRITYVEGTTLHALDDGGNIVWVSLQTVSYDRVTSISAPCDEPEHKPI